MTTAALPLFHLYGDPPDDQAFDFIHIETIACRSSLHDWIIRTHRHRNLFNLRTVMALGLAIPDKLLALADEMIE